jgi:hypothetical protein
MIYTPFILFGLGLFGIIIHNLVKMNEINKQHEGNFNYRKYIALEKFSIALSICVVVVCVIIRTEIKQLENAGNWLGVAFVTVGYMAQSIIIAFMGKAQKIIDNDK